MKIFILHKNRIIQEGISIYLEQLGITTLPLTSLSELNTKQSSNITIISDNFSQTLMNLSYNSESINKTKIYKILIVESINIYTIEQLIKVGVEGIICCNDGIESIYRCIKAIVDDNVYVSDSFKPIKGLNNIHILTKTERFVLHLILEGNSNLNISKILCRSVNTVMNHRKNIKRKLSVKGGKKSLVTDLLPK